MSPISIKFFKNLLNHPTLTHMKFEIHRILLDGGSPPIKGFLLTRWGFTLFMLVSPCLLAVQGCVIVQNLGKSHVYISL